MRLLDIYGGVESRKHRMRSRHHLALKMDQKCIRKMAPGMCSGILLTLSQGYGKMTKYFDRFSTI